MSWFALVPVHERAAAVIADPLRHSIRPGTERQTQLLQASGRPGHRRRPVTDSVLTGPRSQTTVKDQKAEVPYPPGQHLQT
jgi:hypothetical protein